MNKEDYKIEIGFKRLKSVDGIVPYFMVIREGEMVICPTKEEFELASKAMKFLANIIEYEYLSD